MSHRLLSQPGKQPERISLLEDHFMLFWRTLPVFSAILSQAYDFQRFAKWFARRSAISKICSDMCFLIRVPGLLLVEGTVSQL